MRSIGRHGGKTAPFFLAVRQYDEKGRRRIFKKRKKPLLKRAVF